MTDPVIDPVAGLKPDSVNSDAVLAKNRELLAETKAAKDQTREVMAKLAEYESAKTSADEADAKKRGEFDKLEADMKSDNAKQKARGDKALIGN